MKIAVASGKGGTGKTTVAVGLARSVENAQYLDCDVEEPNAALFLNPDITDTATVTIPVPRVDEERCTYCGTCAEVCAFHAMVVLGTKVLIFPELCHGCGSCAHLCPAGAITEEHRPIGEVQRGTAGEIVFAQGVLNVGEPMAPPVIKQVQACIDPQRHVILDSPPGTSCPVIETVRGADFCLLVTEPTPFGLHDLRLAVDTMRTLDTPCAVVINSWGVGDGRVDDYCAEAGVPVLMRIPWDRRIAEGYSRGQSVVDSMPELRQQFQEVFGRIQAMVAGPAGSGATGERNTDQ